MKEYKARQIKRAFKIYKNMVMIMLIDGMYIAEWKNTDQNVERK